MCFRASVKSRRILQTHCARPFILYSTGVSWCILGFFVKNIMALSSVGLYSAIQMEVKAAAVQWLQSTPKLQQFKMFTLIKCWKWSIQHTEMPEPEQDWLRINAQNGSPRSHKQIVLWWTVLKIKGLQETNTVIPPSLLKHISKLAATAPL